MSAAATAAAVLVALFIPAILAWLDARRRKRERRGVIHEVCSAADQILAYRDVALSITKTEPVYHVAFEALERIGSNATTLSEVLKILSSRPELTDGAVYSAVAAQRIASEVARRCEPPFGQTGSDWPLRSAALEDLTALSGAVARRVAGVRREARLSESHSAAEIRRKYGELAREIEDARANNRPPVVPSLSTSHY